jgi:dTDP-4-amino-4,6-dideoxygalactose transaminase
VFVDVEADTYNIDPSKIEAAITDKTRAILPVHLFGQPADMTAIMAIAAKHNLQVIEDCAQSFGASVNNKMTGGIGIVGCHSFFPSKNLGCYGDGGMITTNDDTVAAKLKQLRNHGSAERYHHDIIGYNSRLDEMQAVILRSKLKRIVQFNEGRRRAAHQYSAGLNAIDGTTPPHEDGKGVHVYHQYTLLTDHRDEIMKALNEAGIACAVYYPIPLHQQKAFAATCQGVSLPVSEELAKRCMSLPIYPELTEEQVESVLGVIRGVMGG